MQSRLVLALVLLCASNSGTIRAAEAGSPADPNLRFIGRWDRSDPTVAQGRWAGAYIRMGFTGTSVRINLAAKANLRASIDGAAFQEFSGGPGTVDLAPAPLGSGEHTLLLMPQKEADQIAFKGFDLAPGAKTLAVRERPIIEFIGDSITVSSTDREWKDSRISNAYAWQTAALLDADAVFIAKSGVPMVGGDKPGMGVEFAKDKGYQIEGADTWKPTYSPDIVIINLGANDTRGGFVEAGITMITQLRTWHPKAQIVCLRPFGGQAAAAPPQIVETLKKKGMTGVRYIDTTGWLEKADYMDGVHTTVRGSRKSAEKLKPFLEELLKTSSPQKR